MDVMTTKTDIDQMSAQRHRQRKMTVIVIAVVSVVILGAFSFFWSVKGSAHEKGMANYEAREAAKESALQAVCTPEQNEYVKTLVESCVSRSGLEYCFGDGKNIIILEVCEKP